MRASFTRFYCDLVFNRPWLVIVFLLCVTALFGWHTRDFQLDASADSLLMEGDQELEYSRQINNRYSTKETVTVAFTPDVDLFSDASLEQIAALKQDLLALERIDSVNSLLDVPVFGDTELLSISEDYDTLLTPGIDREAAREELVNSPVFSNALISPDGQTAALLVSFARDDQYQQLLDERQNLRQKRDSEGLTEQETQDLATVSAQFDEYSKIFAQRRHEDIEQIRTILSRYEQGATLYLGGAPMIADDLVTFVRNDLATFSAGVFTFIVFALGLIFRRVRWVVLPLACCALAGVIVVGILGLMDWRVTVVSSNFMSLLLIITISLTVHLMVRYRQLRATRRFTNPTRILRHTVLSMWKPCLFTSLTTIVAFASLIISDISPIISFGWIMVMGVVTALTVVFLLFPALMSLLKTPEPVSGNQTQLALTTGLARLTDRLGAKVLWLAALLIIFSGLGVTQLKVENSFIDYFSEETEIYQGMTLFDEKLGGTLSFDVVVNLPEEQATNSADDGFDDGFDDEFDDGFDDGFDDEFDSGFDDDFGGQSDDAYWFTGAKMDEIKAIHSYLDENPQTGKVLSFGAVIELAEILNGRQPVDSFVWALLYSRIPDALKSTVVTPFVSIEQNQVRFNVRVRESDEDLNRNELITGIETGLQEQFGYADDQVHVTGVLVLYNNVLQSLYQSQILTLGVVLLVIMVMFLLLFRSLKIAALCILPNILAALFVLGVMGWLQIPLDIMTITIAAIAVGIGVDNTIHYMHRFKREFYHIGNYKETMYYCHDSIARAMYFTSMTIVAGFSILVLSNFIPTIVFGLLTSIAMLVALLGSLTLLPQLLISFKPLGEENH
ncbi:MAG: MMPL family transporter [Pseudohongiellaceae bacterium]|nr:MMPL family transporter [Pseudohongiellaceae bacterium]